MQSTRCESILVTGAGSDQVAAAAAKLDSAIEIAVQREQLGTGHAVQQVQSALVEFDGDALVLFDDVREVIFTVAIVIFKFCYQIN